MDVQARKLEIEIAALIARYVADGLPQAVAIAVLEDAEAALRAAWKQREGERKWDTAQRADK